MEEKRDRKTVEVDKDENGREKIQGQNPVFKTLTYAKLLEKQGFISEAKGIYEDLLSTYPREEVVKRNLERLKKIS
jgi:hypothetical protein